MDEFLSPSKRQARALQFEQLRQTLGMSVLDYAREFTRLSKYAAHIIPTEAERIQRFRAGLVTPLYTALAATEFTSLSRLVDVAKQVETRQNADRTSREQRKRARHSHSKGAGGSSSHMKGSS